MEVFSLLLSVVNVASQCVMALALVVITIKYLAKGR